MAAIFFIEASHSGSTLTENFTPLFWCRPWRTGDAAMNSGVHFFERAKAVIAERMMIDLLVTVSSGAATGAGREKRATCMGFVIE